VFIAAGGGEQSSGRVLDILEFIEVLVEIQRGCCRSRVWRL